MLTLVENSLIECVACCVSAAISTSFWDQLLQNKVDSNTLFAMTASPADRGLQPSTPTFYSYARDTSQGLCRIILSSLYRLCTWSF